MNIFLLKNGNKPYDLRLQPSCGTLKRKAGICKAKALKILLLNFVEI